MPLDDGALIAARLAREHFGLEGTVRPLPGELDRSFGLDGHVLKLHAPGTDPQLLDLQDAALEHLAAHGGTVSLPRLRRTRDGAARVRHADGFLRVLGWVDGTSWAAIGEPDATALRSLGRAVAEVDRALESFEHAALDRQERWNLVDAADLLGDAPRGDARAVLARFASEVAPRLTLLPTQAIHNDANEHNIFVDGDGRVSGLIDFGDVCRAPRVCGLAVACAYAMTGLRAPERQVAALVAGHHEVSALTPAELALVPDLIRVRLAMSTAMAARQHAEQPDNGYLLVSQRAITDLLARLGAVPAALELPRLRAACGYEAVPTARAVRRHLATTPAGPVCRVPLDDATVLDWSTGSPDAGKPPADLPALGRYLEDRPVYAGDAFATEVPGERRTLHLGVDVFLAAGEPILAPLDGVVRACAWRPAARDWGGTVLLDHTTPDGTPFQTLYGHLDRASAETLAPGAHIRRGDVIGHLGSEEENGGGAPPLPPQLLTVPQADVGDVHGVGTRSECAVWESVCPDPNLLLGLPRGCRAEPVRDRAQLLAERRVLLSSALSLSYGEPLRIVRGAGAHL